MRANISTLAILGMFLSATSFAADLKISAGATPAQNVFPFVTKAFEKDTGIHVVFTNKNPKGHAGDIVFKEVDEGTADAGASGSDWDDWLKMVKEKGYNPKHEDNMHSRVFGRDRIQFVAYKGAPAELNETQLQSVLTGRVRNWKEVGGEDANIVIVQSEEMPLTVKFLEARYLGGKKIVSDGAILVKKSEGPEGMLKAVANTKGAIGFGPVNLVNPSVKVVKTPVIGRPITMIWLGKPHEELLKFLDFIEKQGPKLGVVQ